MDAGPLPYRLLQAYVLAVFGLGPGTVGWVLAPHLVGSPQVAGIRFGVRGFGLLLVVTLLVVAVSTDRE